MADYEIGVVSPLRRGERDGWGFAMYCDLYPDEQPHRDLIEKFAVAFPQAVITLPIYERDEDFVECHAIWNDAAVEIYFETILSYLEFWSEDREAVQGIRSAIIPLAY